MSVLHCKNTVKKLCKNCVKIPNTVYHLESSNPVARAIWLWLMERLFLPNSSAAKRFKKENTMLKSPKGSKLYNSLGFLIVSEIRTA